MKKNSLFVFLMISFLIHVFLFGGISFFPVPESRPRLVDIDYVSPPVLDRIKSETLSAEENLKRIVDQADKSFNNEESKNAKYLSKNTQRVEKETVAKNRGEFRNSAQQEQQTQQQRPQRPQQQKNQMEKAVKQAFDPLAETKKSFKNKMVDTVSGETPSNPSASGSPSQTQDYLKNTDIGVETILNTKEFKYYTYFNRIRRQLSHYWEPKVREKLTKMFRQGRNIASNQDRITKLLIILDPVGLLVNVQVLSDSGVKDLDEAAIEAFRSAAPFPNPPQGIVEEDGTVKIRWDFILES